MSYDVIVLGAGPAGLGAALAVAREGGRVALIEAADRVGGLCVTLRRDGLAYDLGGHILFVEGDRRREWLAELLGEDLIWVDRPVVCVRDGTITRGRYLDQPDGNGDHAPDGGSAAALLAGRFGADTVDRTIRRYLEKVDGMPLERIVAERARKLLVEQSAPDGFWYPAGGIGQLMEAMAAEIRARGGEVMTGTRVQRIAVTAGAVAGVDADGPGGAGVVRAPRVIAGLPAARVAGLVDPPPPPGAIPALPQRAAAIVYLELPFERVTEHAWIQVDHPLVPFARLSEPKNWSPRMAPPGRTVLGCECYCHPGDDDVWWQLTDDVLGSACAAALAEPLGLIAHPTDARLLDVVRLPRAWSLVSVDQVDAAAAPWQWLADVDGLAVAQGGDVIRAIAAGEAAAVD